MLKWLALLLVFLVVIIPTRVFARNITLLNSCKNDIVVGYTGANLQVSCSSTADCLAWCAQHIPNCPPLLAPVLSCQASSCYFAFSSIPARFVLKPSKSINVPLATLGLPAQGAHGTGGGSVVWSGNFWASTGCDAEGRNCVTGICNNCTSTGFCMCGISTGLSDPVTRVEATFETGSTQVDTYDVSIIPGANVPMAMSPVFAKNGVTPSPTTDSYWCGSPGSRTVPQGSPLQPCSWLFNASAIGQHNPFPDIVLPSNYGPFVSRVANVSSPPKSCVNSSHCTDPLYPVCGVLLETFEGKTSQSVVANVCGDRVIGIVSPNGICTYANAADKSAQAKTLYPSGIPYACVIEVPDKKPASGFASLFYCARQPSGQKPSKPSKPLPPPSTTRECGTRSPTPKATSRPTASNTPQCSSTGTCVQGTGSGVCQQAGASLCCEGGSTCPNGAFVYPDTPTNCTQVCGAGARLCQCPAPPSKLKTCNEKKNPACFSATGVCASSLPTTCCAANGNQPAADGWCADQVAPCHCPPVSGFPESPYQKGATDSQVCGCVNDQWWADLAPPATGSTCNACSEPWVQYSLPWLDMLKEACPTAYTYPYDDPRSTFTCADINSQGNNTQSYVIEFCPGSIEPPWMG